jgi:hypothetical protein
VREARIRRRPRVGRLALFGVMLAAPAWTGCRSAESRELEGEISALGRHIDALRNAENEKKPAFLRALEQAPCRSPEGCGLQSLCVTAYTKHLDALAASRRAKALVGQVDAGRAAGLQAAEEVTRADRELTQARLLTQECAAKQGALRRIARAH